jgi:hypothetical protein
MALPVVLLKKLCIKKCFSVVYNSKRVYILSASGGSPGIFIHIQVQHSIGALAYNAP